MLNTVEIKVDGKIITAEKGEKISSYLDIDFPCGGHGKCGKCRVKAEGSLSSVSDNEIIVLSEEEIKNGVRLACCTKIVGECEIETFNSKSTKEKILADGVMPDFKLTPMFKNYGVSIDIGTTTIAARIYDVSGKILGEEVDTNPQTVYGADVVTRIEKALNGELLQLKSSVVNAIDNMILKLFQSSNVDNGKIDEIVITGNTAMMYLLTGTCVDGIAKAPFKLERRFNERILAGEIGLKSVKNKTEIFIPACISPFVGADIACAILTTGLCNDDKTKLLIDIGTNGELCLWHKNQLWVSSTAAGPAFEGAGISCGMRAKKGAIDKVFIKNGELDMHIVEGIQASGICGSGLVDAVASLLELGVIDETGLMKEKVELCNSVYITPQDVRMVQMTKSAICAGIKTMMDIAGVEKVDITELAGGFGSCLNMENAVRIGLLPSAVAENVNMVGNAALSGASAILLNKNFLEKSQQIASSAITVELASNPIFSEHYMIDMLF